MHCASSVTAIFAFTVVILYSDSFLDRTDRSRSQNYQQSSSVQHLIVLLAFAASSSLPESHVCVTEPDRLQSCISQFVKGQFLLINTKHAL